jgi:hypothetical protein
LRLTRDEARDLKLAVDVRLHGLRVELNCTETKAWRAILRDRLDRLEAIVARLDADTDGAELPAS